MEPVLLEIPEHGESFQVRPHEGEEFGCVLEGSVILENGDKEYPIKKGETFYITGKNFHKLKNIKKTTAKVLWVCTPPVF